MKLRNKKTGEIKDIQTIIHEAFTVHGVEMLKNLEANWEDYKPVEPLIKDPKIRKAVRAWAEAEGIKELAALSHLVWGEEMTEIADKENFRHAISFRGKAMAKTEGFRYYSVAELCGEEEE